MPSPPVVPTPHSPFPIPEAQAFSLPIRVYWEDTDAGGVVYHAAYVRFLERARTEWLRALGVSQQALREREDVVFAVHGMRLDFLAPARLDDVLEVEARLAHVGRASVTFAQRIVRPRDARVLLEAEVRVACLAASTFRPRALPDELQAQFCNSMIEVS